MQTRSEIFVPGWKTLYFMNKIESVNNHVSLKNILQEILDHVRAHGPSEETHYRITHALEMLFAELRNVISVLPRGKELYSSQYQLPLRFDILNGVVNKLSSLQEPIYDDESSADTCEGMWPDFHDFLVMIIALLDII